MSDISNPVKKSVYTFAKVTTMIIMAVVAVPVIGAAFVLYVNWSTEREAKQFCDSIAPASDVSLAIKKFEERGEKKGVLHYEFANGKGHSFTFRGFVMDQAECTVLLDQDGKVKSKKTEMQYD